MKLWLEVGVIVGSIQLSIICVKKSYKSVSKLANAANAANAFMLRKNHGSLNYSLIGAYDTACALNFVGQIGN